MRYNKKHKFKKSPSCIKSRQPVCRAAALGMAGAVLVLQTCTASACVRTDEEACVRADKAAFMKGKQVLPDPYPKTYTGIPGAADRDEKRASDGFEEGSLLEKWDIDPDDLPQEEIEEIPPVPEEIREYFEDAVAYTVEKYDGSTPPAPDLSKYSLRADTIRAGVRAKAHGLMKKESGQILDRMSSYALSFGGPAISKMLKEMQSRTVGKMTAFGKGHEDDDGAAGSGDAFSSSPDDPETSPSGVKTYGRGPFLTIMPPFKEQSAGQDDGSNDSNPDNEEVNISETRSPAEEDYESRVEEDNEIRVEEDVESRVEEDDESRVEEDDEIRVEEDDESAGEDSVRPGGEHVPGSRVSHTPPGMYSFLSFLPGGNIIPDEVSLSSDEGSSGDFSSEEDSSQGLSSEEDSSQGLSSEEDSSEGLSSEEYSVDAGSSDSFSYSFSDTEVSGSSDSLSDSFTDTWEAGFGDNEIFPDLTANFALARPLTSGSLYYKYGNKGSRRSGSGSEEKDDSRDDRDDLFEESSVAETTSKRNIVFIGDSRTVGMEMFVGGREDEYWCAKNSMGYSWMVNTAAPSVDNLIGENTDVVILMGVNDLGNVNLYVDYMNEKAAEWKERGARTFFVSVTPVVDSKSPNAKNSRIESFNAYAIEHLRDVHYIDAYNRIRYSFGSPDGIHFDAATYREIYRIIHFYLYQGWYEEAGLRFYFDCGEPLTGWHLLDGSWQYMDGAGVRWISNSRVGDVCLAPYPMTGLTDPDPGILAASDSDTDGGQ